MQLSPGMFTVARAEMIDTCILRVVKEKYIHTMEQFGFQSGMVVHQGSLHVRYNTERDLQHTDVLDLGNALEKVGRRKLLHTLTT